MAKKGKPLKILVCAASGKLGRAIVADALDKDHSVAAIVRTGGGNSKPDLRVGRSDELADVHVGDAADQAFVSKTLASGPFDVVCVAVGAEAADVVTSVISAVAAAEPSPVLMMTGGAPALVARDGKTSAVDWAYKGADWARELANLHLGVTWNALRASTIPRWSMVCPSAMVEGKTHGFHRTRPEEIDKSSADASLRYEAVAAAFVNVAAELVAGKETYNKKRVAFTTGNEMSCYQYCCMTLVSL